MLPETKARLRRMQDKLETAMRAEEQGMVLLSQQDFAWLLDIAETAGRVVAHPDKRRPRLYTLRAVFNEETPSHEGVL